MKGAVSTETIVLFIGSLLAVLITAFLAVSTLGSYADRASTLSADVRARSTTAAELVSAFYFGKYTYVLVEGVAGEIPLDKVTLIVDGVPQDFSFRVYRGDGDNILERGELFYLILPYHLEDGSSLSLRSAQVSAHIGVVSGLGEFYFPYRIRVRVTNTSGSTPTDYPIRVELNADNFQLDHLATSDCTDVRPVDENMKPLDYYVEECGQRVVLWVKLPRLDPEVNFYILYGRSGLPSDSNAHKAFNFFDDVEVFSGWKQYGNGEVKQYCDASYDGRCSLLKTTDNDPNGGLKNIGTVIGRGFVMEAWLNRLDLSGGTCDRIGIVDSAGNGYGFLYCHSSGIGLGVDKRNGYTPTILSSSNAGTDVVGDWFLARLIVTDTEITAEYYYGGALQDRVSVSDTTYSTFEEVYVFGGYNYLVDRIVVRKIVTPEPSVEVGPEESGKFVVQ